jgi:Icc-related predicted phosphoesterase
MRIMLAGDTHGNLTHIRYLIGEALEKKCDAIFVLGDFGFWPHSENGIKFIEQLETLLELAELDLFWLDGNHENHDILDVVVENGDRDDKDFVLITPRIRYAPRGHVWVWGETKFMALGGAFSVDRSARELGVSWWNQEMLTWGQAEKASKSGKVDILLCHDGPANVDYNKHLALKGFPLWKKCINSEENKRRINYVVNQVMPKSIFHGHIHMRYSDKVKFGHGDVYVEGLDCDFRYEDSWCLIDV